MLDAINVIAQYARDQAVVSARDQAVSPRRMVHREHISVWSLRRTASYRITILRLPDINYNRRTVQVNKLVWAELVCTVLGTHGSASLSRVELENKMAATYMY